MQPRRRLLPALALSLAACGGAAAHGGGAAGKRDPVCALVDGQYAAWRGLPAHTLSDLPECIGERAERTQVTYHGRAVDLDYYHPARGVEVWLYGDQADGKLELIELRREGAIEVGVVRKMLGEPATAYHWADGDRADPGPAAATVSRDPDVALDELVYPDRGLSMATATRAGQPTTVFRARGFAPSTADAYLDAFVRQP